MSISNRRLEHWKAKEWGDELDVFVKKQTGSWRNPVVSTAEVVEEFDMEKQDVLDRLVLSDRVMGKQLESGEYVWW